MSVDLGNVSIGGLLQGTGDNLLSVLCNEKQRGSSIIDTGTIILQSFVSICALIYFALYGQRKINKRKQQNQLQKQNTESNDTSGDFTTPLNDG
jgi:hypothetical protein